MRIQPKPRWADEEEPSPRWQPTEPVPRWCKLLALLGMALFWLYFLGWLGAGGQDGMETGFLLFGLCQLPLLWRWLRGQMGRGR